LKDAINEITRKAHLMAQAVNAVTAGIACAIRRK
jgi:hypothetical protein